MAKTLREGDRVRIVDREVTPEDVKSGLFYNHFRGLVGTLQKIYDEKEAAVVIEVESMPETIAKRHIETEERMRNRWLDGLSEEARNRLTPQERAFTLRYVVLVALKDLLPYSEPKAAAHATKTPTAKRPEAAPVETPPRKTSEQLDAAEEAELAKRRRN
jgi:ribosomal protein L21E